MKKVVLVCDGSHFSEGAFKMATYLQTWQPMLLTGVFLGTRIYNYVYSGADSGVADLAGEIQDEQDEEIAKSKERFKALCNKNGIEYHVHEDVGFHTTDNLRKEMRFANLAIIGTEVFFKSHDDQQPSSYLIDALHHAACPVLLVPKNVDAIAGIILAYDGSDASVHAIKQFAGLLPELSGIDTLLVYATDNNKDIPNLAHIEELAARYFSSLVIFKMDKDPKEYFATWLAGRKNSILVTGSYGPSGLCRLFRPGFVTKAIEAQDVPIFIAHQ